MRFQVSRVMDTIEQRLTTDVTWAQAVVDLGEVARHTAFDGGRPVNLVRIGMVVDALSRYLVDEGAMLYGVVARQLLSESALTAKERMVLSRWADDGLIEVTPEVGDRVVEIADLTGLPVLALRPYAELGRRYPWLADGSGRVLRLTSRHGVATLSPLDETTVDLDAPAAPVVGRAKVLRSAKAAPGRPESGSGGSAGPAAGKDGAATAGKDGAATVGKDGAAAGQDDGEAGNAKAGKQDGTEAEERDAAKAEPTAGAGAEEKPENEAQRESAGEEGAADPAGNDEGGMAAPAGPALPLPAQVLLGRGAAKITRTLIGRRRFMRAEPTGAGQSLLSRQWRCQGMDCPAFGEYRRIGQPVPRIRYGVPVCPRHGEPVADIGPRPAAYALSIVVDDLPRRRLVVRAGAAVRIGRVADDPEVVSVARWLHRSAAAWISPVHVEFEADDGLTVMDKSDRGTVVWQRKGPDDPGTARLLRRESYLVGEWDSVELYTGIELARGDRRLAAALGRDEPASVLLEAPTAAHHRL